MCKVGHANIKRLMRETGAVFAGEVSMHFYFKELWNCESGDLAMVAQNLVAIEDVGSAKKILDLIDALELMIIPVTLGTGKRLFQDGTIPAALKVTNAQVAPKGIICATYERDGDVKSGSPKIKENE